MSKNIILIFCLMFSYKSEAQLTKGNISMGELSSFSGSSLVDEKSIYIYFAPQGSYFISDNLSLGIITPLFYYRFENDNAFESNLGISLGSIIRYYFDFDKWALFPQLTYVKGLKNKNSHSYSYGSGLTYFIDNKVSLEGVVTYGLYKEKFNDGFQDRDENRLNFNIGFQIFINRKKSDN